MHNHLIYMDDAATTAPDPGVVAAMAPWWDAPANPHIRHHAAGAAAARAVDTARAQIATAINAPAAAITFTAGATEANNILIHGLAAHLRATGRTHIITSTVEHSAILAPLAALDGFTVTVLPVKPCGMIEADAIARALTPQTGLVTVQAVNNVTGTVQPLSEIAAVLRDKNIIFHTDAAQALGKIAFDINEAGVDAATLSGHKIYGPSGIGALYVHEKIHALLKPLTHGGGQERGLRPGTLPTALCVGFGAACALLRDDRARLQELRARFLTHIAPLRPEIFGHSDPAWNVPGIIALRFPGIDHESLLMMLPYLAFSTGSACGAQGGKQRNHVISAIAGAHAADETIRLSFGRNATTTMIDDAAAMITAAVNAIRSTQTQEVA